MRDYHPSSTHSRQYQRRLESCIPGTSALLYNKLSSCHRRELELVGCCWYLGLIGWETVATPHPSLTSGIQADGLASQHRCPGLKIRAVGLRASDGGRRGVSLSLPLLQSASVTDNERYCHAIDTDLVVTDLVRLYRIEFSITNYAQLRSLRRHHTERAEEAWMF